MNTTIQWLRRYRLHHLLAWILLFWGWYYFRYEDYSPQTGWKIILLKVGMLAFMVYTTNYLLIPGLLYKKRYLWFGCTFLTWIFLLSLLKMRLEEQLMHHPGAFDIGNRFKARVYDNIIPHYLLASTGAAFKLLLDYAAAQKRLSDISKEKLATELSFLKSQINPHFVFNTLNAIHFLIDKQNKAARASLQQFAGLLRYQLYDCSAATIEIEKETAYLEDYIRLQQLRQDRQYAVTLSVDPEVKGFRIVPLLLAPFIENAFKHLSHHADGGNFISIGLQCRNNVFLLEVENSTGPKADTGGASAGIGLANVQRRLELLYPGKHELKITNNDSTFKVTLKLQLI
jgi:sensor histidine kinase YesM